MAHSQEVSRPGNDQYLVVEHDGAKYEAEKHEFQREQNGELVDVEEYRLGDDDAPAEVVEEIERANGERQEDTVQSDE